MEQYLYTRLPNKRDNLNAFVSFPGIRSFGLSAIGYLNIFKEYDISPYVNAEMLFSDTKETAVNPKKSDIIAFSMSFELDIMQILKILEKYDIPFLAKDRSDEFPLICGGGVVLSSNPEPYAEFFDFIELGDGEKRTSEIIELIYKNRDLPKKEILKILSEQEGIYVPSMTKFDVDKGVIGLADEPFFVKKVTHNEIKPLASTIISSESFFKETYIIEVSRGCPQKCTFCNTSYLNHPYRVNELVGLKKEINNALNYTKKIALLGAAVGNHPNFDDLMQFLYEKSEEIPDLELSISSLRVDKVSDIACKTLVKCGQKHATVAIEVGSERLRKAINKNISDEQILNTIAKLRENGFKGVKMYAMVGLPSETDKDIEDFIGLMKTIKKQNKGFSLSMTISSFIPKAKTPLQYAPKEDTKTLERKINYLKKELHKLGVEVHLPSLKWDYVQALLSRGDRRLTDFIITAFNNGGNLGAFKQAQKEYERQGIIEDFETYVQNGRNPENVLPWDFIQTDISSSQLKNIYSKLEK